MVAKLSLFGQKFACHYFILFFDIILDYKVTSTACLNFMTNRLVEVVQFFWKCTVKFKSKLTLHIVFSPLFCNVSLLEI